MSIPYCSKHIWQNDLSQSTRSCSPLEISFEKETEMTIQVKFKNLFEQINALQPYIFDFNGFEITVQLKVFHTMFDQKCINGIMNNRCTSVCVICGLMTSQFKQKARQKVELNINAFALTLGISLLRC